MNTNEKLLFEIGVGFDELTPSEISRNETIYNDILDKKIQEYGYDGDGPYYESVKEFAEYLYDTYGDNEIKLIQSVGEHNDWNMFGWALANVSLRIKKYATAYLTSFIEESSEDADFIMEILSDPTLPS